MQRIEEYAIETPDGIILEYPSEEKRNAALQRFQTSVTLKYSKPLVRSVQLSEWRKG